MLIVHDEQNFNSLAYTFLCGIFICLSSATEVWAQSVSGQISRVGDTTHLEFKGRKDWNYESPEKQKDKLVITVPAFDESTLMQLQSWSDSLIKSVQVNKDAPDGRYEVAFQFVDENVESFDYLTDDPPYLIFDFYKQAPKPQPVSDLPEKKGSPAKNQAAKRTKNNKVAKLPEKVLPGQKGYKKVNRAPAGSETLSVGSTTKEDVATSSQVDLADAKLQFERGTFDGGDPEYSRFRIKDYEIKEESIIASRENIYIPFPMLAQKVERFDELMRNPPIYEVKTENDKENKEARFLLKLFERKHWGAFFETAKYFQKKYPKTRYDEIIANATAEAHIRLYERDGDPKDYDKFRSIYKYLIETYPDSVLTERNHLLLAYSSLKNKDGAATMQDMQKYLAKYPNSSERDYARLALAEAYVILKKPDDAIRVYEDMVKDPLDKNLGVEAAYRVGDVYFGEREFEKALVKYKEVQSKYPAHKSVYPNAEYNSAESQFWLNNYKESLNGYIEFLQLFPTHKHGGYAITRIGELLGILGADQRRVMGAYIEGYFRYPDCPGSEVARIRMLSQGLKGISEREKKKALTEINDISAKSTLPRMKEFAVLMIADGLSRRGENPTALDGLLRYYQENPTTADLNVFRPRILRNISDILRQDVEGNKFIEALNFYGKYSTTWLKNANRIDTKFFRAVAFENAGVVKEAARSYAEILNQLNAIQGKKEERERRVYENLPTISQVSLRLAKTALLQKQYRESFQHLGAIKGDLAPKEEVERVQIGAAVAEKMGESKQAIQYLEKLVANYKDEPGLLIKPELDLARLYLSENKITQADAVLNKIEKLKNENGNVSDEDWSMTLQLRGDLQFESGQKLAAIETYTKLLDAYEKKYSLSSVRYKAGKILFDNGDIRGAEKIWSSLENSTGQFYKKLANEKLNQAEWQDAYKKYINRIPAAEELK